MADLNPNLDPNLQRHPTPGRPPDHLSATDEERPTDALKQARSSPPKAPFEVFTPKGFRPFYPPQPEPIDTLSDEYPKEDNPLNPRGGPSLSLPQQATPLTSQQGVLSVEDMADESRRREIAATQDGLAPDDPMNPRGTPDYIVEGLTDPDAATTIHQVTPTTTPVSNTPITLELLGQGFPPDADVMIDGTAATSTTFTNPNRAHAEFIPDTAGVKQITVGDSAPIPFEVTTEGVDG